LIVGDGRVIENSTLLVEGTKMVQAGRMGDDYVQPSIVKLGITARAKVAAEVEQAGALCVPNAFYIGPAFLAVLHCLAAKEKASPLERMFADFGVTPVRQNRACDQRRSRSPATPRSRR
jgi:hypothetical protein